MYFIHIGTMRNGGVGAYTSLANALSGAWWYDVGGGGRMRKK
jgi:hypothetical protein